MVYCKCSFANSMCFQLTGAADNTTTIIIGTVVGSLVLVLTITVLLSIVLCILILRMKSNKGMSCQSTLCLLKTVVCI